jgi:glycosyltransferase involved in cell wall biosynthesis
MPLISVVIPIYNVESYLHQCVTSVLSQDFRDIEVILVNDGSTDSSPAICDELALFDQRIKLINKPNGGSSDARNRGIDEASGDYIMFLDSDDYWEGRSCLSGLVDTIQRLAPDVIVHRSVDLSCITQQLKVSRPEFDCKLLESLPKSDLLAHLISHQLFPGSAWTVVSKRILLREKALYFKKGIKAEDIDWLLALFSIADCYAFDNSAFYIYRKYRSGSITTASDSKSLRDVLWILNKWLVIVQDQTVFFGAEAAVLEFLAYHYLIAIMMYSKLKRSEKEQMYKDLNALSSLLHYGRKNLQFTRLIYKVFGLDVLSYLLFLLYEVKKKFA